MIEFGRTLREAREAKGLSVAQLADLTHMTGSTINELENEDFTHIPAPIYGRGFVKLYCVTVGLDPKPLLAEFMDILNGNRDDCIRERPIAGETPTVQEETAEAETPELPVEPETEEVEPEPADEVAPSPEPPREPVISQQDFFQDAPVPEPVPGIPPKPATPLRQPLVSQAQPQASRPATATEQQISRYATPIEQTRAFAAPAYGRIALLGAAALLAILLVLLGLRTLYRATSARPAPAPETTKAEAAADEGQAADKKAQPTGKEEKAARTPQRIPSLYID